MVCTGIDGDETYPLDPSTPPEPAPHDPSLGNSITDPRSSMCSNVSLKSLSNTENTSHFLPQQKSAAAVPPEEHPRLVKASTMPSTGSHPSLEDSTCRLLTIYTKLHQNSL